MKIATIIGARPQFIKAAAVSRAIANHNSTASNASPLAEINIHTGQHYNDDMSAIFFRELEIPEPKYNLNIGSGSHGKQTGRMLTAIEKVLVKEKPDWVLIYGDTNSTLAGALAAAKLHIRIAHVEAGLRSFNRVMPEEINRVIADQLADLLFCPSQIAVNNLAAEGIPHSLHCNVSSSFLKTPHLMPRVVITGDVMADALQFAMKKVQDYSNILTRLNLLPQSYLLATVHRAENTDDSNNLSHIIKALSEIAESETVIFPIHPRTKKMLKNKSVRKFLTRTNLKIINPVGYFDIIALEKSARIILTDSGGVQKEAYWLKVPCITLRDETEWVETLENGWNRLTGANATAIINAAHNFIPPTEHATLYGDGNAATKCLKGLLEYDLQKKRCCD